MGPIRPKVNPNFKFCPKFSQSISHIRRLKNAEEITTQFYNGILAFGDKLGPLFLQLSDNFTPKSYPELKAYLEHLPTDVPVFVEVRHKEWFNTAGTDKDIFKLLRDLNIGSVITDATGRRDCVHMNLTTPHAFIRFVGNGLGTNRLYPHRCLGKRASKNGATKACNRSGFLCTSMMNNFLPYLQTTR